ncbi:non-ribosomal peptide synthetase [Streptomyces pseudovenezuelae]|uniref:Amino acid adenylation domain-containing protein/non-ribosomal peptide synthase protein (TIGR01720 family) n=1 Tax=Streptomyces pseudovenezuelae TaxID=67350 RepID=A0ABT6LRZ4_9ACTN|nr:non-ribosomal peptide synthetase [Streptomyces pseudovenezuelae]MDH6219092.1 amino acid adenylation domain-containing protein/non-ribosomal peptide synthase protein (TIGR01720 family) [Streptomyces pseudovenezuelae]
MSKEPGDDGSLVEDVLPLSPLQQGLLFHALFDEGAQDVYTMQTLVEIEGPLRPELLRTAAEELYARHANLRSAFLHEDLDEPVQVVLKQVAVDWKEAGASGESEVALLATADATARFDLTDPPLLRLTLVDRGDDRRLLILTNHHLLLDGWSIPLLVRELLQLYAAQLAPGRAAPLPAVRPYRDFLAWLASRDRDASTRAWREALAGATPTLLSSATAGLVPVTPELHTLRLSEELTGQVEELARRRGVTVNTVVQGLWALLLARLTGRGDVVFGATVAGRPAELAGAESMIGLFINTVPVRVAVPPGEAAGAFLRRLQDEQARLMGHQHLGLTEIQRLAGAGDLFDTLLVFENYPIDQEAVAEAEAQSGLRIVDVKGAGATHYPLTLAVLAEQQLGVVFEFRPDCYERPAVEELAARFERLLRTTVSAPDTPLAALDVLAPEERAGLLAAGIGERLPAPYATLPEALEAQAARTPDAVAVVGAGERLTFAELNSRANRLARVLVESGAGPERFVALALPPTPDTLTALLAVQKAGAAYLPLDPAWPGERIAGMLADSRPVALLATEDTVPDLDALVGVPLLLLDDLGVRRRLGATDDTDLTDAERSAPVHPEHPAYVIYTSGSTGRPKAVVIPQRAIANLFAAHNAALHTPARAAVGGRPLRVGHAWPTAFDASWQPMLWMFAGHELHLVPEDVRRDPDALRAFLAEHGIEFIELSPSLLAEVVAQGGDWQAELKVLGVGGEAVPPDLWRTLRATEGLAAHNLYGPTECTVDSANCDLALSDRPAIGRPVAGGTLYVLDGHLNPVPTGVDGELYIAGEGLARGYLGRPGATASRFVADPFTDRPGARMYRTGDIARWTEDGLVECLGRIDDQVKIRGYRIEPGEIEVVLLGHELVERAAVVVREDTPGVRRLVAYVVLTDASDTPVLPEASDGSGVSAAEDTAELLRRDVAAVLPDYMVPSAFVTVDGFPLTLNGKLDTAALPAPTRSAGPAAQPPRNPVEERLAALFADVLGLDTVGVHDSFFVLGGDSIVSMRLVSQARAAGLGISPRDVFEQPTVAGLAERAGTGAGLRRRTADPDAGTGEIPLTPMLTWLIGQGGPFRALSQARFLRTPAGMDLDGLHRTVQTVLDRHDLLRASFAQADDGTWSLRAAPAGTARAADCVRRIDAERLDHTAVGTLVPEAFDELVAELDPAAGAVARFLWFDPGEGREGRLLVVLHHLVTDAASWGVLVAELAGAWDGSPLAPPGTSFKEWAEALRTEAQSPRRTAELPLWQGMLDRPEPSLGSAALDPSLDTRATIQRLWTTLGPGLTGPLTAAPVQEALLTALTLAVPDWRRALGRPAPDGDTSLLIALEGHGREEQLLPDADLSGTLGWFTSVFPVRLDPGDGPGPDQVRRIGDQLVALPDKGIGYGLLHYLNPDTAASLAELPQPQIEFNYLGRMTMGERRDSAVFTSAPETGAMGSGADPGMAAPYPLVVDAVIADEELSVCWQWPERLFAEAEIQRLADAWATALELLLKGGEL